MSNQSWSHLQIFFLLKAKSITYFLLYETFSSIEIWFYESKILRDLYFYIV